MAESWFATLFLLSVVAGCSPRSVQEATHPTAPCGLPNTLRFHGVHALTKMDVSPDAAATPDGCAIISFGLDPTGKATDPALEEAKPRGSGVGEATMAVIARNTYAPNGEGLFGDTVPQNDRYAVTVGFAHQGGRLTVAFRTPFLHQPGPVDRARSDE